MLAETIRHLQLKVQFQPTSVPQEEIQNTKSRHTLDVSSTSTLEATEHFSLYVAHRLYQRHCPNFNFLDSNKIFRPVQNEDGFWRLRMNYKLNDLIKNTDIVRFVKSKRMAWLGHVMRMEGKRILN